MAESFTFAKGGVFASGLPPPKRSSGFAQAGGVMARNIEAYTRGGIVDTPEAFAFAGGSTTWPAKPAPEPSCRWRARSGELGVRAAMTRVGRDVPQGFYRLAA